MAAQVQPSLNILNHDYAGSTIMLEPDAELPLESLNPLTVLKLDCNPIDLGWNTFLPRFYQQIKPVGITHGYQLLGAHLGRKDAYLLGNG